MNVTLNYNGTTALASDAVFTVSVKTTNDVTLELSSTSLRFSAHDVMNGINQNLSMTGQVIGYVHLNFLLESGGIVTTPQEILPPFLVTVVRFSNTLDSTFTIIIAAVAIINTVNMGCGLDLNIVKQNILRPVGPVVGFISQFTFMPLFSFAMAWLLIQDNLQCFGLLVMGVCPGGIGSNFWTLLLDGDVNLSITMTFISTIAALGMMPFWLWLLSGFFLTEGSMVQVPFLDIALSLIFLTIPIGIGQLIRYFKPNIAKFITEKFIKPFSFCVILLLWGLGFYTLSHIFILLEWRMLVAGLGVAASGFIFGALFAWMARLNRAQIIAVSMETALQNGNIAFILLKVSLPTPYSDIAALPPIAQILMVSIILFALYFARKFYECCLKKSSTSLEDVAKIRASSAVEMPLVRDYYPENVNKRQYPITFHGGDVTPEFSWVKRSSAMIVPNSPTTDSTYSPAF